MSASKLTRPAAEHRDSFLKALSELQAEGRYAFLDANEVAADFDGFLGRINSGERLLRGPQEDWVEPVPETVLWMVKGDTFIGNLNIRHRLNWHLERWGGHMHFVVRPSWRGKGFGRKLLRRALPVAAHLGIERALLTVALDNTVGAHVVQACGGVLEDETEASERFPARRRYWIETGG